MQQLFVSHFQSFADVLQFGVAAQTIKGAGPRMSANVTTGYAPLEQLPAPTLTDDGMQILVCGRGSHCLEHAA